MTQWLVIYGPVEHPHVYATAYDQAEVTRQITKCAAHHGAAKRVRSIQAEKLPPSRIKS